VGSTILSPGQQTKRAHQPKNPNPPQKQAWGHSKPFPKSFCRQKRVERKKKNQRPHQAQVYAKSPTRTTEKTTQNQNNQKKNPWKAAFSGTKIFWARGCGKVCLFLGFFWFLWFLGFFFEPDCVEGEKNTKHLGPPERKRCFFWVNVVGNKGGGGGGGFLTG